MEIQIPDELKAMMGKQLERIKRQFIEEQFSFDPKEGKRFTITEIEEQCLVYPKGTFKVEGEYRYGGETFFLQTYMREDKVFITIIREDVPEFNSMKDAIAYCRNSVKTGTNRVGRKLSVMEKSLEILIETAIGDELETLSENHRKNLFLENYSMTRYCSNEGGDVSLRISFKYKDIHNIDMVVSTILGDPEFENQLKLSFQIDYVHTSPLTSLAQAVEFIDKGDLAVPEDIDEPPGR